MIARPVAISLMTAAPLFWPAVLAAQDMLPDVLVVVQAMQAEPECRIDAANQQAFSEGTGLSEDALSAAALVLVTEGVISFDAGGAPVLRLIPAVCDPAAHGDMRESLIAGMRLNDCAMTEDEGDLIFVGLGLTRDMVGDAGAQMVANGEVDTAGDRAILTASLCEGLTEMVSPRGVVLTALRGAGCEMPQEAIDAAVVAAGLPGTMMGELMRALEGDGTVQADGDLVRLVPALCEVGAAGGVSYLDPVESVLSTLRAGGCRAPESALEMSVELLEQVLPRAIMDAGEGRFEMMIEMGDLIDEGDSFAMSDTVCAGGPGRFDQAAAGLVAAIRANDCRLSEDAALAHFAGDPLDRDLVEVIGEWLVASGQARIAEGTLVLAAEACRAPQGGQVVDPGAELRRIADLSDDDAAFEVDRAIRAAGCTVMIPDRDAMDSRLAAPLAANLGYEMGVNGALDQALRDLAMRGISVLRSNDKLAWEAATAQLRLLTCS